MSQKETATHSCRTKEREFSWSKHAKRTFDQGRLLELNQSNALTDVLLLAGTPENKIEIPAHRVILSLASAYFWELFVDRKLNSQVRVAGIDPQALVSIINFIYSGRIDITEEGVENLFIAGELLDVGLVQVRALQYMIQNINMVNCGRRLTFARSQNSEELAEAAMAFIVLCYKDFLAGQSFLELEVSEVAAVLNCQGRMETPEEDVFTAVLKWLKCGNDERKKHSARLLKEIDLTNVAEDFLQFHFQSEQVLHTFDSLKLYEDILRKMRLQKSSDNEEDGDVDEHQEEQSGGTFPHSEALENSIYIIPSMRQVPTPKTKLSPIQSSTTTSDNNKRVFNGDDDDDEGGEKASAGKKFKLSSKDPGNVNVVSTITKVSSVNNKSPLEKKTKMVARKRTGGMAKYYNNNSPINTTSASAVVTPNAEVVLPKKSIASNSNTPKLNKTKLPQPPEQQQRMKKGEGSKACSSSKNSITGSGGGTSSHILENNNNNSKRRNSTRPATADGQERPREVIVYLTQYKDYAQVMMHDLVDMIRPKKLRMFSRNNKQCTLVWSSALQRLYALGGVTSLQTEIGSSPQVRFSPQSTLMEQHARKYWQSGPNMIQERNNFVSVILDDYMYAFGGSEGICGNQAVNCAERLCLTDKKAEWEEIDYLQRARQGFGASVLNGKIYVVGGYGAIDASSNTKMGILNTVEMYDPSNDTWKFVAPMQLERCDLAVVTYNSKLYAIGGGGQKCHTNFVEDSMTMRSVEVYDPDTDTWERMPDLNRPRRNGYAAVLNGIIYAIGGDRSKGEEDIADSSVEKFNFDKNKWSLVWKTLDRDGTFTSAIVMDMPDYKSSSSDGGDSDDK